MTDNLVVNKFTGDSSSAQRAIAELEKKVDDLGKSFVEGKSKAKAAAIAAKQAAADSTAATKADAAESRKVLRNWVAYNKQSEADPAASRRTYHATIRDLERQEMKEKNANAAAKKKILREQLREQKKLEKEQSATTDGVAGWAAGLVSVQAVYGGITSAIQSAVEYQKELIRLADEQGRSADRRSRSFAVNAGLNDKDQAIAAAGINAVAIQTGVSAEKLEPAASELVGSDFSWQDASGKALKNLIQANGVTGDGDVSQTAGAIGLTLNASGMAKTAENIDEIGSVIFALRKMGRTEMDSMRFLAPELAVAQDRPFAENAALMAMFEDVAPASKGAGAFGSFHKRLRAPTKETTDALALAGIKPEDVNFVGEDTPTILKRLSEGYGKMDPNKRGEFIKGIAGGDYLGLTDYVLKTPERYDYLHGGAKNKEGYEEAKKKKFSGLDFAAESTAEEKRQRLAAMATAGTVEGEQRDLARTRRGMSSMRSRFIENVGWAGRGAGLDAEATEGGASWLANPRRLAGLAMPPLMVAGEIASMFDESKYFGVNAEAKAATESKLGQTNEELIKVMKENNQLVAENNKLMQGRQPAPATAPVKRPMRVDASE